MLLSRCLDLLSTTRVLKKVSNLAFQPASDALLKAKVEEPHKLRETGAILDLTEKNSTLTQAATILGFQI